MTLGAFVEQHETDLLFFAHRDLRRAGFFGSPGMPAENPECASCARAAAEGPVIADSRAELDSSTTNVGIVTRISCSCVATHGSYFLEEQI